jgi:uncharacterized membrane protein YphA (DoxX/SURF4 family)
MQPVLGYFPAVARIALGLIFTVFGLNGFFGFLPQPPLADAGGAFIGALAATGYMFPLIKGVEVAVGLALLGGRFVPLALTLLAPVTVNIVAFHAFLSPGLGLPLVVLGLHLYLAYQHRDAYRGLFEARTQPSRALQLGQSPSRAGRAIERAA